MAAVRAVRAGLVARLQTISGLRVYDNVPGQPMTPAAVVRPGEPAVVFDSTMARGCDEMLFTVLVLVSFANHDTAQDALDPYLSGSGDQSLKAVIEAEQTLGGVVSYARVARIGSYGEVAYAGATYLGADFTVEVLT